MKFFPSLSKIKRLMFLLKERGFKYTLNYIHFNIFFGTKNPFLLKYLYLFSPSPSYVEIEVSTRCNLRCLICEHTYWKEPSRDMTLEQFKSIINQLPKLKWIGLTGIGESFMNKDFLAMLKYVKDKNIFVELYDTFYFIDQATGRQLIEMGIDKMFISLDAATKETYEKIRVRSDFYRVTGNLRNFFRMKKEKGKYFPQIAFHFIANKLNIHEIPQYIELVSDIAGGEKTTIQITRMLHCFKEVEDLFMEIPKEIISKAEEKAKQFGIKLVWNADSLEKKPSINKCSEWIMPFIFSSGHVIPCCAGNEAGHRDFQKETALGNVFEKSFKEIWRGEKYKDLRKKLSKGKVPLACKDCCLYEVKK